MPPACRLQVFANGPLWRAARAAWQPFFKQASARAALRGHIMQPPRCPAQSALLTTCTTPQQGALDKSGPLMAASAGRLCDRLAAAANAGAEIDVWRALGSLTLDIVGSSAFGCVAAAAAWGLATVRVWERRRQAAACSLDRCACMSLRRTRAAGLLPPQRGLPHAGPRGARAAGRRAHARRPAGGRGADLLRLLW